MSPSPRLVMAAALGALAVAGYAVLHTQAGPARAAAAPHTGMPQFLRFSGSGSTLLRPDRATIDFSTSGRGTTLAEAEDQASVHMAHVIAALRSRGIAGSDMTTNDVSGSQDGNGGYTASQGVTVTVRQVWRTSNLLAAGLGAGAQATYGPQFSLANRREGQSAALRAAVGNARAEADSAAQAAGLHVTGVLSISEANQTFIGYQPMYAPDALAAAGSALPPPIKHGTQRVTAQVTVVFSYAPGPAA